MSVDPRRSGVLCSDDPRCYRECRCSRWPDYVNRFGNYVVPHDEALEYYEKVLSYGPIAYWPLWETSGLVAECLTDAAMNADYSADVSGWPPGTGIGDGNTAPYFDGTRYVDLYSAALNAPFDEDEHTLMGWLRIPAAIWTDGVPRYSALLSWGGFTEYTTTGRIAVNNQLGFNHRANGVNHSRNYSSGGRTDWFHWAITVSAAANATRFYIDGVELLPAAACAAAAAANLDNTRTMLGGRILGVPPTSPSIDWQAHVAVFGSALDPAAIENLAAV